MIVNDLQLIIIHDDRHKFIGLSGSDLLFGVKTHVKHTVDDTGKTDVGAHVNDRARVGEWSECCHTPKLDGESASRQ